MIRMLEVPTRMKRTHDRRPCRLAKERQKIGHSTMLGEGEASWLNMGLEQTMGRSKNFDRHLRSGGAWKGRQRSSTGKKKALTVNPQTLLNTPHWHILHDRSSTGSHRQMAESCWKPQLPRLPSLLCSTDYGMLFLLMKQRHV